MSTPKSSSLLIRSSPMTVLSTTCGARTSISSSTLKTFCVTSSLPRTMIVLARRSAMIFVVPMVTACGVVSAGCVCSSSETESDEPPDEPPNPPPALEPLRPPPPRPPTAPVALVVRCPCAPAAPWPVASSVFMPGSVMAFTITGSTSPARTYFKLRIFGSANLMSLSNSLTSFLTNGRFVGRVTTRMRLVRTSAESLMRPEISDSSDGPPALMSTDTDPAATPGGCPGTGGCTARTAVVVPVLGDFSKIFSSFSSTSFASARSSWMNSVTTSAGATSICPMIWMSVRMTAVFSVTRSDCAFGSATIDV